MSVTLRAFVIDADDYRAVQGSHDVDLVERVTAEAARELALEDSWARRLRPDHLPIAVALRDIVGGDVREERSAALSYAIAALMLAEYLGERIDGEEIAEVPETVQPAIDEAIAELLRDYGGTRGEWPLLADVLVRGPSLAIPRVYETLPNGTGLVSTAEARRAARLIQHIPQQEDEDARALALLYGGWLVKAAERDRALLLACD